MPEAREVGLEVAEVALHDFQNIGVGDRRRRAFVLAQFADHLVRECDAQLRVAVLEDLADAQLVLGMPKGMQQADTDCADAARAQFVGQSRNRGLVQGAVDGAVGQNALGDGEGEPAGDERRRLLDPHVVHVVAVLTADQEHVTEPLGDEQRGGCSLALDHRVRHQRRRVRKRPKVAGRDVPGSELALEQGVDAVGWIAGGGEHFTDAGLSAMRIHEQQVRERSADVHSRAPLAARHRYSVYDRCSLSMFG